MKIIFLIALIGFSSVASSSVAQANDCIIDPQKVMVHASSEPLFIAPDEKTRDVASQNGEAGDHYKRKPDEYLEVLKAIPASEPKVHRAWLEYKIMKEE